MERVWGSPRGGDGRRPTATLVDGGGGASEIPSEPGAAGMGELLGVASAVAFRMDLAGPPLVPPPAGSTSLPRGLGTQMVEAAAYATHGGGGTAPRER